MESLDTLTLVAEAEPLPAARHRFAWHYLVRGNPLQPDSRTLFRKPAALVDLREPSGELGRNERALANIMLAHAARCLVAEPETRIFSGPARQMHLASKVAQIGDSRVLRRSLERLAGICVELPALKLRTPLFLDIVQKPGDAELCYRLPDPVRRLLLASDRWAEIDLALCRALKGKHGLTLYEHMMLVKNRRRRIWRLPIDAFRAAFGVGARLKRSIDLRVNVIDKAVAEVCEATRLRIEARLERQYEAGPVVAVSFEILSPERPQTPPPAIRDLFD